ncbi:MAG: hypothetical protein IAG10_08530, partial [Planctomycetaceae bacterium]|nr:hypothetical protein [Planctomycetaceae bacterium]
LAILAWPASALRSIVFDEWRRLYWLLGGSLFASLALAAINLWFELPRKPPEQHYSWHGWWLILCCGSLAVGVLLVLWRLLGPGLLWLWKFGRERFARHA